jgi:hypothetical protein
MDKRRERGCQPAALAAAALRNPPTNEQQKRVRHED